jgi:hypothetical protein
MILECKAYLNLTRQQLLHLGTGVIWIVSWFRNCCFRDNILSHSNPIKFRIFFFNNLCLPLGNVICPFPEICNRMLYYFSFTLIYYKVLVSSKENRQKNILKLLKHTLHLNRAHKFSFYFTETHGFSITNYNWLTLWEPSLLFTLRINGNP